MKPKTNHKPTVLSEVGERLYNLYHSHGPNYWQDFEGKEVKLWNEVSYWEQDKWKAVAFEVLCMIRDDREERNESLEIP